MPEPIAGGLTPRDVRRPVYFSVIRYGVASVWVVQGLGSKLLDLVPRHRAIVGRVVCAGLSGPLTACIGVGEMLLGVWVLSGRSPKACAAVMTVALVCMNTLEIAFAKDLLLAPYPMVGANVVLVGMAWYLALADPRRVSGRASDSRPEAR